MSDIIDTLRANNIPVDGVSWRDDGTLLFDPSVPSATQSAIKSALGSATAISLGLAKDKAMTRLSTECQAAIEAGASSSALGSAHTYPTDKVSQLNLSGEVSAAIVDGPAGTYAFMCADGTGVWDRRPHTDVQIKQVGQDVRAHVKTQLSHLDALRANVMAATTKSAINAVVW